MNLARMNLTAVLNFASGLAFIDMGEWRLGAVFIAIGFIWLATWRPNSLAARGREHESDFTTEDLPLVRGSLITLPDGWTVTQLRPEDIMITRSTTHATPLSATEMKVIQGRIGSLNNDAIEGHKPYSLTLRRVACSALSGGQGWVVTEFWEPNS